MNTYSPDVPKHDNLRLLPVSCNHAHFLWRISQVEQFGTPHATPRWLLENFNVFEVQAVGKKLHFNACSLNDVANDEGSISAASSNGQQHPSEVRRSMVQSHADN